MAGKHPLHASAARYALVSATLKTHSAKLKANKTINPAQQAVSLVKHSGSTLPPAVT